MRPPLLPRPGPSALVAAACAMAAACANLATDSVPVATPSAATTGGTATSSATTGGTTTGGGGSALTCVPTANEVSVGLPCTAHGGECSTQRAGLCTADLPASTTAFCSRLCVAQDCGTNAACLDVGPAGTPAYLCVPNACIPAGVTVDPNVPPNPCITPAGNARLVGKSCTYGGGECASSDPNAASTCLADIAPGTPISFCTRLGCQANADCGTGATCETQLAELPQGICLLSTCANAGSSLSTAMPSH